MLVYLLLGIVVLLILLLTWALARQPLNQNLMKQNQELLNRLQAPDLKTFVALQTLSVTPPDSEIISLDDESEANRYQERTGNRGENYLSDEQVKTYSLNEFGLNLSHGDSRTDFN